MTLNTRQRRALKRKVIQAGQTAAGLDDAALIERARALGADDIPGETPSATDAGGSGGADPGRDPDADYDAAAATPAATPATPGDASDDAQAAQADAAEGGEGDQSGQASDAQADAQAAQADEAPQEDQDADDDGDPDAPQDTGESEHPDARDDRQQQEREARGADDDPIRAMMREIANVEIDGREHTPQIDRLRSALVREINRRRKLARRTARAIRILAKRNPAAAGAQPAAIPAIEIRREGAAPVVIEGAHPALETLVKTLRAGIHPLLVGPAGSGKSTLAQQAAEALDLPFYSTGAVHQKYELTGYTDAAGAYVSTTLYKVAKEGGVFLWDEIDASMPQPLVAFNQLLANGVMYFPNGERVDLHADAYFIGAANTVGTGANRTYVGRNALDAATLDRYFQIEISYDEDLEHRLAHANYAGSAGLSDASEMNEAQIRAVDKWLGEVRTVRRHVDANGWGFVISPRASIQGARLLAAGVPIGTIRDGTIYKHLSADQRRQIKAAG